LLTSSFSSRALRLARSSSSFFLRSASIISTRSLYSVKISERRGTFNCSSMYSRKFVLRSDSRKFPTNLAIVSSDSDGKTTLKLSRSFCSVALILAIAPCNRPIRLISLSEGYNLDYNSFNLIVFIERVFNSFSIVFSSLDFSCSRKILIDSNILMISPQLRIIVVYSLYSCLI